MKPSQQLTRTREWALRMAAGEEIKVPRRALEVPVTPDGDPWYPRVSRTKTVVSDPSERALWKRLADEIDAFIAADHVPAIEGQDALFNDATDEGDQ